MTKRTKVPPTLLTPYPQGRKVRRRMTTLKMIASLLELVRMEALEEAARECDALVEHHRVGSDGRLELIDLARRIRALGTGEV